MKLNKNTCIKLIIGVTITVIVFFVMIYISPILIRKLKGSVNSIKVISNEQVNTGVLVDTNLQYNYDNDTIILKVDNNSMENIYLDKVEYRDMCNIKEKECSNFKEISISPISLSNNNYTNITISSARSKFGNDFDIEIGIKYTMGGEEYITTTNVFSPVLFDENSRNIENNDQTSEEFSFYAYNSSQWNASAYNNAKMFVKLTDNDIHMEKNENLSDLGMTYYMKSDFPYRWYIENPFKESTYNAKMLGLDNYSNFRTYFDYSYPTEVKEGKASFTYDNVYFNMSGTPKQILTNETIIPTFFWIMRKCSTSICASYDYQRTSEDNNIFKSDKLPQFKLTVYNKDSLKTAIQQAQNKLLSKESLNYDNVSYYNLINYIKSAKNLYSGRDYYNKCDKNGSNCIKTETSQAEIDDYVKLLNNYTIAKIPLADYTSYNNLLNEISANKEEWYPADSYAEFKAIYDERNDYEGLSSSYQIKVDNYVDRLQEAFNNLNNTMYDADYTSFDKIYEEVSNLTPSYYVDFSAMQSAIEEANSLSKNLKIDEQAKIDNVTKKLEDAKKALVMKDADYTSFNKIYGEVSKLTPSYYEDFSTMQSAIEEANSLSKNLKIDEQAKVDKVTKKLEDAKKALVMYDADYTSFNKTYEEVSKLTPSYYEDFSAMQSAIEEANSLSKNLKIDEQAKVDNVTKKLEDAKKALVMKDADYTSFNKIYGEVSNLTPSYYVDFSAMQSAIEEANSLSKNLKIDEQAKVDKVTKKLETAKKALVMKDADYSKINLLKVKIEQLDENKYTNFEIVTKALKMIVYGKKINEQDKVDNMYSELKNAYDNLIKVKANYSELEKAIENAKKYESNKQNYTNYQEVENLINSVNYNLTWDEQSRIDELTKKINEAVSNLNKKPANYAELSLLLSRIPSDYSFYDNYLQNEIKSILEESKKLPNNLKYDEQSKIDYLVSKIKKIIDKLPVINNEENLDDVVLSYLKVNDEKVDISSVPFKYVVEYGVVEAKITVGLALSNSKYTVYGGNVLMPGDNNVTIVVNASDGKTYTYTLIITRKTTSDYLSNLSIKESKINFNKNKQEYTIKIDKNTNKLDLSLIAEDENAKVTVKGNNNLKNGSKIEIKVESADGSVRVYTLNVQKAGTVDVRVVIILIMVLAVLAGVFKFIQIKKKIKEENNAY